MEITDREHAIVMELRSSVAPVEFRHDIDTAFYYNHDDAHLVVSPFLLTAPVADLDEDLFGLYIKAVAACLRVYSMFAEHPAIADRALEYTSMTIGTWLRELNLCNDLLH